MTTLARLLLPAPAGSPRRPRRILGLTTLLAVLLTALVATSVGARPTHWFASPRFDSQGPLNAIALWTHAYDADDADLMMEAFTDDPTFVFTLAGADEPLPAFEGRDAVEALFTDAIADQAPDEVRRHVTTNHLVEQVGPRTAQVQSYLTLLQSTDASLDPDVIATGVYTDTIVLGRDRVWRIDRRELVLDTPTDDDDLTP